MFNIYATVQWNKRHLWLENLETEEAAQRLAARAIKDNPGSVMAAWVEPSDPDEQRAMHDAISDMQHERRQLEES